MFLHGSSVFFLSEETLIVNVSVNGNSFYWEWALTTEKILSMHIFFQLSKQNVAFGNHGDIQQFHRPHHWQRLYCTGLIIIQSNWSTIQRSFRLYIYRIQQREDNKKSCRRLKHEYIICITYCQRWLQPSFIIVFWAATALIMAV